MDWHDHNAHLHRDQAIAFFSRVAAEFGDYPNVLYEPYNEPLNVSWSSVIKPYHEAVLRAIRAEVPTTSSSSERAPGRSAWMRLRPIASQATT